MKKYFINVKYRCFEFTPNFLILIMLFTHDIIEFGVNFYNVVYKDISFFYKILI